MNEELSNKKVKFAYEPEDFEGEGNDLDLDTIRASRNKPKGLKEFDSEGSEDEESEKDRELDFDSDDKEEGEGEGEELDSDNEVDVDERQVPLMPFNLKEDREEGDFDSEGFYTRKQDEEADQDRWMSNFTLTDIVKARKAHEQREKIVKEQSSKKNSGKSEKELWEELVGLLVENDLTVLDTIRQLTPKQEAQKPRAPLNKNRLKKLQKEQQQQQIQQISVNSEGKEKMERITELADALMDFGNFGVYEETRRGILRKLNK